MARSVADDVTVCSPKVIVYFPAPYTGTGLAKSCVRMLDHSPSELIEPMLVISRVAVAISSRVNVIESDPPLLRLLPWRIVAPISRWILGRRFRKALEAADRHTTVAYFWPDPPIWLLKRAKSLGVTIVRQMINCPREQAKIILDNVYKARGLKVRHGITDKSVRVEREELALYDYIFCAEQAADGLKRLGIPQERLLPTSSAWSAADLGGPAAAKPNSGEVRFLYVGIICHRKGVMDLLEAWKRSDIPGSLRIVGAVEADLRRDVSRFRSLKGVEFLPYSHNVGDLYASADVFVLPTYEEGDPKVTYEAAAFGLPIVTTPMGAGSIVKDKVNGCVVAAGDVDALGESMMFLATTADARRAYGERARADAAAFTYDRVARDRAAVLKGLFQRRGGDETITRLAAAE